MGDLDPNIVTLLIFAAGYLLSRWDRRGEQASNASVEIAQIRTEVSGLRRDFERFIDRLEPPLQTPRSFGRREAAN
jgi:hypothetical protein